MPTIAIIRTRARAIKRELGADSPAIITRALELRADGDRTIAYELCGQCPRAVAAATRKQVLALAEGLDSWGSTDCYSCFISGVAWREGTLSDADIRRWARSSDRWLRRAAVVSTIPFNNRARGATAPRGDAPRTLAICDMLVDDRDDMVVKAISWALRELAKRDPRAVRAYLARHKEALAPRIRREVQNKLTTGLKNPRKSAARSASRSAAKPAIKSRPRPAAAAP